MLQHIPPASKENTARRTQKLVQRMGAILTQRQREVQRLRGDAESSMLQGDVEKTAALRVWTRVRDKYQERMIEEGGTDKVLLSLENFIREKMGGDFLNPQSPNYNSADARKYNQNDSEEVRQLKTALRALRDPAVGAQFENILNAEVNYVILTQAEKAITARDILAYFWLAASDPEMPLDAVNEPIREQCVEGQKMIVISQLADIRRAHNVDYSPIHSEIDQPSCPPGTFGRIVSMHLYNKLTQRVSDEDFHHPVKEIEKEVQSFILEEFNKLSLKEKLLMYNAYHYNLIMRNEDPVYNPFMTFSHFFENLRNNHVDAFYTKISQQFGAKYDQDRGLFQSMTKSIFADQLFKISELMSEDLTDSIKENIIQKILEQSKKTVSKDLKNNKDIIELMNGFKPIREEIDKINAELARLRVQARDEFKSIKELDELFSQQQELNRALSQALNNKKELIKQIETIARNEIKKEVRKLLKENLVIKSEEIEALLNKIPLSNEMADVIQIDKPLLENVKTIEEGILEKLKNLKKSTKIPDNIINEIRGMKELDEVIKILNEIKIKAHKTDDELKALEIIAKYCFDEASKLSKSTKWDDKLKYDTYLNLVEACGVLVESTIKDQVGGEGIHDILTARISMLSTNAPWLLQTKASFEDIEEQTKLQSALTNYEFLEKRDALLLPLEKELLNQRKDFDELQKLQEAADSAINEYFEALKIKPLPIQLINDKMAKILGKRNRILQYLDNIVNEIGQQLKQDKNIDFTEHDKQHLLQLLKNEQAVANIFESINEPIFNEMNGQLAQIEFIMEAHQAHKTAWTRARDECVRAVTEFHKNIITKVNELEGSNPPKRSMAYRQLHYLKEAQGNLQHEINKMLLYIPEKVKNENIVYHRSIKMANAALDISNKLDKDLNRVGYPERERGFIRKFKDWWHQWTRKATRKVLSIAEVQTMKMDKKSLDESSTQVKIEKLKATGLKINEINQKRSDTLAHFRTKKNERRGKSNLSKDELALALKYINANTEDLDKLKVSSNQNEYKDTVKKCIKPHSVVTNAGQYDKASIKLHCEHVGGTSQEFNINAKTLKEFADLQKNKEINRNVHLDAAPKYENLLKVDLSQYHTKEYYEKNEKGFLEYFRNLAIAYVENLDIFTLAILSIDSDKFQNFTSVLYDYCEKHSGDISPDFRPYECIAYIHNIIRKNYKNPKTPADYRKELEETIKQMKSRLDAPTVVNKPKQ